MFILRLGQEIDGPGSLHHELDVLRLEIHTLVASLVVAEELLDYLLQADLEQDRVRLDGRQHGQVSHSLDHALDIAIVL